MGKDIFVNIILGFITFIIIYGERQDIYVSSLESINKISLTQKGYIQFLEYLVDVPPLSEFTFCLWMRSVSLNFSHPLFSYSKNKKERLIRVWISDKGMYINMAILEQDIFQVPINIQENHWNHYCPSWNAKTGTWTFHLNGKLMQSGLNYKLLGMVVPGHGDLVIGQEYTDFDKGLDDGIEGDIYAFNFVTSATTLPKYIYQPKSINNRRQMYIPSYSEYKLRSTSTQYLTKDAPAIGYFTSRIKESNGLFDFGTRMLQQIYSMFDVRTLRKNFSLFGRSNEKVKMEIKYPEKRSNLVGKSTDNKDKTLGMFLVELSYGDCVLGRGAPIMDEKVIVSWAKTPVRIFGGAILKSVEPFCRKK